MAHRGPLKKNTRNLLKVALDMSFLCVVEIVTCELFIGPPDHNRHVSVSHHYMTNTCVWEWWFDLVILLWSQYSSLRLLRTIIIRISNHKEDWCLDHPIKTSLYLRDWTPFMEEDWMADALISNFPFYSQFCMQRYMLYIIMHLQLELKIRSRIHSHI